MNWLRRLLARLFSRKSATANWDSLDYGKPSTSGDDFRKVNDV